MEGPRTATAPAQAQTGLIDGGGGLLRPDAALMGTPDASRGPTVGRKRSGGGNRKVERWAGERVSWGPPPAGSPRSCFRLSGTIRPSLGRGARPNEATTQRRHARLAH